MASREEVGRLLDQDIRISTKSKIESRDGTPSDQRSTLSDELTLD
jgi:hypothetical protein